jgi:diaminopimelate epimerase
VAVTLPGGDLQIAWRPDGRVVMTGPVEFEREVVLRPEDVEAAP